MTAGFPLVSISVALARALACSFWLVDALHLTGHKAEATQLFERILALRNDVGLLSEERTPTPGVNSATAPKHSVTSHSSRAPCSCTPDADTTATNPSPRPTTPLPEQPESQLSVWTTTTPFTEMLTFPVDLTDGVVSVGRAAWVVLGRADRVAATRCRDATTPRVPRTTDAAIRLRPAAVQRRSLTGYVAGHIRQVPAQQLVNR